MLWDLQNRQARRAAFLPQLRELAKDHYRLARGRVGPEALLDAGVAAFERALDDFDAARDYDLHAYVDIVVRGAMYDLVLLSHGRRKQIRAA
ncbi:MAG: hypothetical protein GY884_31455 [Proteobacteria bacterium]|nr:hypothetical protein [Pseudomonadota bacterium]